MLDIQKLREDANPVRESLNRRGKEDQLPLIDEVLELDKEWKRTKGAVDELRHTRNSLSESINQAKKNKEDASALIAQAKEVPAKLKVLEEKEQQLRVRIDEILKKLPSPLHPDVPKGASEDENVTRAEHGEKPTFDFPVKNHAEICEHLGIADFEASRKTSGSGFFFLKGDLALLDQALMRYAQDVMLDNEFVPIIPPYFIRRDIVDSVVDLSFFEEIVYKIEGEDLYPISTSEHPLVGMLTKTATPAGELPVKLCGISPCFRKEVGAHGIDEKGIYRTHQFHKIEQVVVCKPGESREWFRKLLDITVQIFTGLGLAVRELEMCTGDLSSMKERQFDIEVWSPRRNDYFEVGSCSNLTDLQARRLGIKIVHPDGTREFAHTLNNTALATSRAMVAILENFQQADGTVKVPEALVPYMRGKTVIGKV